MAAAHTIVAGSTDPELFSDEMPPWASGSPEERHFRNNSTYLAPGLSGKVWLLLNLLYGLVINILPFLLTAFLVGRLLGWLHAEVLHEGLKRPADGVGETGSLAGGWAVALVMVVAAFAALAGRRALERMTKPHTVVMTALQTWAVRLVLLAVAAVLVLVATPLAIVGLRELKENWEALYLPALGDALGIDLPDLGAWTILVEAVTLGAGALAVWRSHRRFGTRLLPLVAMVAGPVILGVPTLVWATGAADSGFTSGSATGAAIVGGILLLLGVVGHNVRWSMHAFYRERLSQAFVLRRLRADDDVVAAELPYEEPVLLSQLMSPTSGPGHVPELIVCAAVNVSDSVVPPGRDADSFTFTRRESGSYLTGRLDTKVFEARPGMAKITVPSMMAISGAAVSPSMGKMTRPWARFLLALFNVRLGVWVMNPLRMARHQKLASGRGPIGWFRRGWAEPGPMYVLYEALGRNNLDRDFVYVSDGGHWENLGLVELLRRGCTEIICFDAAGDALDTFNTIGEAIALARNELQVEIDLRDLSDLQIDPETGWSAKDHVVATYEFPDETPGVLVFVKAAMPGDAPWDVKAYRERDPRFPCHSTGDQLFDDAQFESYRTLGAHAGRNAGNALLAGRRPKRKPRATSA